MRRDILLAMLMMGARVWPAMVLQKQALDSNALQRQIYATGTMDSGAAILALRKLALAANAAKDLSEEAMAIDWIGRRQVELQNWWAAISCYKQSLAVRQKIGDPLKIAATADRLAGLFSSLGKASQSKLYFEVALKNYQKIHKTREAGRDEVNLGEIHERLGERAVAARYFNDVMDSFRGAMPSLAVAQMELEIGNSCAQGGECAKALRYYVLALKGFGRINFVVDEANVLDCMGLAYERLARPLAALDEFQRALAIYQKQRYDEDSTVELSHIAKAYEASKQLEKARQFGLLALESDHRLRLVTATTQEESDLGEICQALGKVDEAKGHYARALEGFEAQKSVEAARRLRQKLDTLSKAPKQGVPRNR